MPLRLSDQSEPIPGYKLLCRLGAGGFGEVWKAEAPGGMLKAMKFVHGDLKDTTQEGCAAEQELKALNRVKSVRHPFILSLERADVIDGQLVIVMELADRDLMGRFKECTAMGLPGIPRKELLRYLEEAAEALDLMNKDYGLLHLDIKPQNLFLVHNHIKVADFGLVKDLEGMHAKMTGGVTPLYSAPETFDGWASSYCDQYSLAIVYQELLTGKRPFEGTSSRQLLMQHVMQPPNIEPLPEGDRPVIARALAKKPEDRFPSCTELVRMLREVESRGTKRTPTVKKKPESRRPEPVPVDEDKDVLSFTPTKTIRVGPDTLIPDDPLAISPLEPVRAPAAAPAPAPPTASEGVLIPITCTRCGHTGHAPEKFRGLYVKCRECGTIFLAGGGNASLDMPEEIGLSGDAEEAPAAPPPAAKPPQPAKPARPTKTSGAEEIVETGAVIVIDASCPKCAYKGYVPEKFLGRTLQCRKCKHKFTVQKPAKKK